MSLFFLAAHIFQAQIHDSDEFIEDLITQIGARAE